MEKTFGATQWSVYSCSDARSVVVVAAPGSPAAPFVFIFAAQGPGYRLHGEGTGRKEATAAAYEDLKKLSDKEVMGLVEETQAYAKELAAPGDIAVETLGEGRYLLTLTKTRNIPVQVGQRELLPTARSLCKGQEVEYGKYKFEGRERVVAKAGERKDDGFVLRQEVSCIAATNAARANDGSAAPAPDNWMPGPEDEKGIERLTLQYFSAKDAGRFEDAYSLLADSLKTTIPFDRWRVSGKQFNAAAGKVKKREIKKITWYKNPRSAEPGIYAAADFGSTFANLVIHCGYVVWHKKADGSFRVVREEQNYIDRKTQQGMDEKSLAAAKAKFGIGCR